MSLRRCGRVARIVGARCIRMSFVSNPKREEALNIHQAEMCEHKKRHRDQEPSGTFAQWNSGIKVPAADRGRWSGVSTTMAIRQPLVSTVPLPARY